MFYLRILPTRTIYKEIKGQIRIKIIKLARFLAGFRDHISLVIREQLFILNYLM